MKPLYLLAHKALDIFLIFTMAFTTLLWYWYLRPYNPLEIEQPLIVLNQNKEVKQGEILEYLCVFNKNTDIKPRINRRLIDGIVYAFPQTRPTNPVGANNFTCTAEIPHSIPVGTYVLDTSACYQMNPIREVCVDFTTEEFTVIGE